jgi:UDP-N-acetylmuramoylalanine--D-glutamate ligase
MIDLSRIKDSLKGKPVFVVGMGRSAASVFKAAEACGIETILWDDSEIGRGLASDMGARVSEPTRDLVKSCAFVCLSPGVPLTHPKPHTIVRMAKDLGVEVIGDMELFHRARPDVRTIGITGTNGKSTTTALVGHILKKAGVSSAVGGNIGEAVLSLPNLGSESTYVLELSSYQLDLMHDFAPDISVLINLSPDHLDRHGDMEGYIAAKERIFKGPGAAIIGMDDEWSDAVYDRQKAASTRKMIPVSCHRPMMTGVFVSAKGVLFDGRESIVNLSTCPALKGAHNWQNAAMAYATCHAAGLEAEVIARHLQTFPGLAHRQKTVAIKNGISYINDSKATNDQAAAMALKTFSPVYWIAGGKSKGGGYADCEKYLGHVRHAFLIGAAEDEMAAWLTEKKVMFSRCGNLATATVAAHRLAQKERMDRAAVLLSPACASFDQFRDFEARGDAFCDIILRLTGGAKKKEKKK